MAINQNFIIFFDNFAFTNEDNYLYLNMINFRLIKLFDIYKQNLGNESFDVQ